jgi:hypothetical protein
VIDQNEIAARRRFAVDPERAAYFWQVRRMPDVLTQETIDAAEILIAEYDVHGILHRLAEIRSPKPYLWVAETYRAPQGIPSRFIPITPAHEFIWQHRVRHSVAIFSGEQILEDCLIFGRRQILTGSEDVMLIYPDGTAFEFDSVDAAMRHKR